MMKSIFKKSLSTGEESVEYKSIGSFILKTHIEIESSPFEGMMTEIVKKRYRLFTWQDRKIELNSKRELLYSKKVNN